MYNCNTDSLGLILGVEVFFSEGHCSGALCYGLFYNTNIRVRFSDGAGWEGWADFLPSDVHKQYGIAMKTPKYRDGNIKEKTKVFLELYKPSDESVSEPQDFFFLPPLSLLGQAQVAHPSVK